MKQLLAGVVLLFVIGIAAFLYRNTVERPGITVPQGACTMEARICPDGSSVGRQGPSCEFAPCAFPNVELPTIGISFVLPEGYTAFESVSAAASFEKLSLSGTPTHTISIHRYSVAEGETAEEVIVRSTRYQPADMAAEDLSRFETVIIAGRTYRVTVLERFEALVMSSFFLVRENDVLRFDITEHDVTFWTETDLDVETLPEHQALRSLLESLQTAP